MNNRFLIVIVSIILVALVLPATVMAEEDQGEWMFLATAHGNEEGWLIEAVLANNQGESWVIETSSTAPTIERTMFVVGAGNQDVEDIVQRINTFDSLINLIEEQEWVVDNNTVTTPEEQMNLAILLGDLLDFMGPALEQVEIELEEEF